MPTTTKKPKAQQAAEHFFNQYLNFTDYYDDGTQHIVIGVVSSETLDSQNQVVSLQAMQNAMQDYMEYANVRVMHPDFQDAVGRVLKFWFEGDKTYVQALIVDPLAWEKVKTGVYKGFSIGADVPSGGMTIKYGTNGKPYQYITKIKLVEISLVDRPANSDAKILIWKGTKRTMNDNELQEDSIKAALANPVFAADDVTIAKAASPEPGDETDVSEDADGEAVAETNSDAESESGEEEESENSTSVIDQLLAQHNAYMKCGNYDAAQMIIAAIQNIQNAALDQQVDANGGDGDEDDTTMGDDFEEDEIAEPSEDGTLEMAAQVTKAGRAISGKNAGALQAAHDHIMQVAKAAGITVCKADAPAAATYTTDNTMPNGQAAPSPKKKQPQTVAKSANVVNISSDALSDKLVESLQQITKSLQAINSRVEAIESKPRGNGPILNGTAVEKSFSVTRTISSDAQEESPAVLLRKALAVETNPMRRSSLETQLADYEMRAALAAPRPLASR